MLGQISKTTLRIGKYTIEAITSYSTSQVRIGSLFLEECSRAYGTPPTMKISFGGRRSAVGGRIYEGEFRAHGG